MTEQKKFVKASNLAQAEKQLSKFDGIQFPKVIEKGQEHGFHILYVNSRPNLKTLKFDHVVNYQVMNERQWEITKKTAILSGECVILHDPKKGLDKDGNHPVLTATALKKLVSGATTEEEVDEEKEETKPSTKK